MLITQGLNKGLKYHYFVRYMNYLLQYARRPLNVYRHSQIEKVASDFTHIEILEAAPF